MVLKRMLFIALIAIVINAILISPIYAIGDVISSGKNFLNYGQKVGDVIDGKALQSTSNFIFNMFLVVAIVLAVGVGTVLGIKFITSSVEGQAKIKEAIIPYIVGCVVIFAAFPIWSFIVEAGQDATETGEIDVNEKSPSHEYKENYYCSSCGAELDENDQKQGRCFRCGSGIKNI